MADRWVWKLIESGDINSLRRLRNRLERFDFNARSKEFGTVFLAFLQAVFVRNGAFPDEEGEQTPELHKQIEEICKFLSSHGGDPTTQAPAPCDAKLSLIFDDDDDDKDGSGDDDETDFWIEIEFANQSALEVLMDMRWQLNDKREKCPKWDPILHNCIFLIKVMSECGVAEQQKANVPVAVIDLWQDVLSDEDSADVIVLCKPTAVKVPAHSVLLRSISPVLKAMLGSPLREGVRRVIEVEDSETAVRVFLHVAYTGCTSEKDWTEAVLLKVLGLAHRWQAISLIPLFSSHLCLALERGCDDFPALVETAFLLNVNPLRQACIARLQNLESATRSSTVGALPERVQRELRVVLGHDVGGAKRRRLLQPL